MFLKIGPFTVLTNGTTIKNGSDSRANAIADVKTGNTPGEDAPTMEAEDARQSARVLAFVQQHPEQVLFKRDVEGIIKPSAAEGLSQESHVVPEGMASNFVVLHDGSKADGYKQNDSTRGILMITAALLYWAFRIVRWILRRRNAQMT